MSFPTVLTACGLLLLSEVNLMKYCGSNYVPGLFSKVPRAPHGKESQVIGSCLHHANLGNELMKQKVSCYHYLSYLSVLIIAVSVSY